MDREDIARCEESNKEDEGHPCMTAHKLEASSCLGVEEELEISNMGEVV